MKKNTLLNLFNENIKEIEKRIGDKVDYIGQKENLKLYDLNFFCCENEISNFEFDNFCIAEYENFKEHLAENNLELDYIGRTSTFRIQGDYILNNDSYCIYNLENFENTKSIKEKIAFIIENYFYKQFNCYLDLYFDENGNVINFNYEDVKRFILDYDNSKDILKNIYFELWENNAIEEINNIYSTYDYIKEFKENSIEYFKEYLDL